MNKWYEPTEADWVLLNNRLMRWQEKRTEKLLKEYQDILNEDKPANRRFRELRERIAYDEQMTSVATDLRKDKLLEIIISLITEGTITADDLYDFSPELRQTVIFILQRMGYHTVQEQEEEEEEELF